MQFVDFVFGNTGFVVIGIFFRPVRMIVGRNFPSRVRSIVDRWGFEFEPVDAVRAHGMTGQRRIPGTLVGGDRAPVLDDNVHVAIEIADKSGVGAM